MWVTGRPGELRRMISACSRLMLDLHIGREAVEVHHQAGILPIVGRPVGGVHRRRDLVEVVVLLAPEDRAPGGVQAGDVVVEASAQPRAERPCAVGAVAARRAVTAELVVGLPCDDVRVVAQRHGHSLDDAPGVGAIAGVVLACVLTLTPLLHLPVALDLVDVRVHVVQPGGIGGRGGAEDGLDAVAAQEVDRLLQPAEVELPLAGLHAVPGELGHADAGDAGLLHQASVGLPTFMRPVFGVVGDAEDHEMTLL